MTILRTASVAVLTALIAGVFAASALAHNGQVHAEAGKVPPIVKIPVNKPKLGLVYNGLKVARTGPCRGAYKLGDSNRCTHGPDAPPARVNVKVDVKAVLAVLAPIPTVQCDGNGTSGKRVHVIYARSSDKPDRYAQFLNSIRLWAAEADAIYRNSAGETGGERHIRFVHNSSCVVTVANAVMPPAGDDNFTQTQAALAALGFNRTDRKYMIFADANVYCGIGNIKNDDSPGAGNLNNGGPSYGRTDAGCWGGSTPAHELMHNIGGVQLSAPHSSGGWHCTDEYDLECYSDSPFYPAMTYPCASSSHNKLFDCNHDDYYHTSPGAGYLTTHWNAANSQYLVAGNQFVWGYVWANDAAAASYTPSASYQRNSTGATNTITRSGVGVYQVRFKNLGVYYGGTVNVTAYGAGSQTCKVASWGPSLADMLVNVRCYDQGGAAVDTRFDASFTRPTSSSRFGYVWADQPSAASYTPNSWYRYNSTGAANTIARTGTGAYTVSFPGLGGSVGGSVEVTAYGGGSNTCKVVSWGSAAPTATVNVQCETLAGAAADTMFTATFHGPYGLLGTTATTRRAYVWADQASSPSYTPSASYRYNSTGGTNTITRSAAGTYAVRLPGLGVSAGHVQVVAYGTAGSPRCKVVSWGPSSGAQVVNVVCHNTAGTATDSRFVLNFVSL